MDRSNGDASTMSELQKPLLEPSTDAADETWKPIPNWNYEVSNLGRVRRASDKRILAPTVMPNGYLRVTFTTRRQDYRVHRLVAQAFLPPPADPTMTVNHKDGVKQHNWDANLEWATPSQQSRHAVRMGLMNSPQGSARGHSKLKETDIPRIRELHAQGKTLRDIGDAYGVSNSLIHGIVARRRWKHIP